MTITSDNPDDHHDGHSPRRATTMNRRYDPSQDGRVFRRDAFTAFADRYRPTVLGALDLLGRIEFEFADLTKAHVEQLRPDLLFRQALPFCVTEETFFVLEESSSRVLAVLFAGHTLALTHLDYHLDGSVPDPAASATAVKLAPATAASYAVRVVFAIGRILHGVPNGQHFLRDVFDPVSGFVVARMHEDWRERYDQSLLSPAPQRLDDYLGSPRSRLLGSGYWEVMVRGSFTRHGAVPADDVIAITQTLRKLRQVVDEIADFDDDLRAGLVTTPLLYALAGVCRSPAEARIIDAVRSVWRGTCSGGDDAVRECRTLVEEAGGFVKAFALADRLWHDGVTRCERELRHKDGFLTLLDLKRAKLQDLSASGWRSNSTERFLFRDR